MRMLWIIAFSITCLGCHPPQVDSCITDLNQIDAAIRNAPAEATREDFVTLVHKTGVNRCAPFDTSKPKFWRPLATGDHTYDSLNWNILLKWMSDHDN